MLTYLSTMAGKPRRSAIAAIVVAVTLVVGVGVTALFVAAGATAARPEPWPSFTMIYQDTILGPRSQTQVLRLTYVDSRHFTTVLLSHSTRPEAVGWTHTVSGSVSTTNDPRFGALPSGTWKPEEQVLPDYWIRPGRIPAWLANRATARTEQIAGGLSRVTNSVRLEDGRMATQTLTYRQGDGIPVLFVETLDGEETHRIEAIELTIAGG